MGCYARVYIYKSAGQSSYAFCDYVLLNKEAEEIKKVPDGNTFRHFVNLDNCNYRIGNCETYIFIISDIPIYCKCFHRIVLNPARNFCIVPRHLKAAFWHG